MKPKSYRFDRANISTHMLMDPPHMCLWASDDVPLTGEGGQSQPRELKDAAYLPQTWYTEFPYKGPVIRNFRSNWLRVFSEAFSKFFLRGPVAIEFFDRRHFSPLLQPCYQARKTRGFMVAFLDSSFLSSFF